MSRKQRSRIATWLLQTAFYIATGGWLVLIIAGWQLLSKPDDAHLGMVILATCVLVMVATVDYWVKFLNVFYGGLFVGTSLALVSGHLLNGRDFPRPISAGMTALTIGCSLVSLPLAKRRLQWLDRVALIAFVAALAGGMLLDTPIWNLVGLAIGFGVLLALWVQNRYSSRGAKLNDAVLKSSNV
jgi:hypothetical protein